MINEAIMTLEKVGTQSFAVTKADIAGRGDCSGYRYYLQARNGSPDGSSPACRLVRDVTWHERIADDFSIGLDTCLAIQRVLHTETGDSKYRPSGLLVKMVEAGWVGKKGGKGFYEY